MKKTAQYSSPYLQEYLVQTGAQLQQTRLEQGLSLDYISKETNIRRALLEQIEAGQTSGLPEPVYLKGLLRCYGNLLSLDGQAIAQAFPSVSASLGSRFPNFRRLLGHFQLRPSHLYIGYGLLIAGTVHLLGNNFRNLPTPPKPQLDPALVESLDSNQATAAVQDVSFTPSVITEPPAVIEQDTSAVVMDVQVEDQVWMRVILDGQTAFEGILTKGEQKQWVASESVSLRSGNAGAVVITINDQQPYRLGEPGAIEEFTYQANAEQDPKSQASS